MSGNSWSNSSDKSMANPDPTYSVCDGMGWGGCSYGRGSTEPGGSDSNSTETSTEDLGGG